MSVAVLLTDKEPLIIRGNPSLKAVKGFAQEQNHRFLNGKPCGPSGEPAYQIRSGCFYESEEAWRAGDEGKPINLSSVLQPPAKK